MNEMDEKRIRRRLLTVPVGMFLLAVLLAACGTNPNAPGNLSSTPGIIAQTDENANLSVTEAPAETGEPTTESETETLTGTPMPREPENTVTVTTEPLPTPTALPVTAAVTSVGTVKNTATATPTAKPLPNYAARATCTPRPYSEYAVKTTYPAGTYGLTNEKVAFRPAVGRQVEPYCYVPFKTKVEILSSHISEWNEIWYKVKVTINGSSQTGYIQACAVNFGLTPTPTPTSPGMVKVPTSAAELKKTYGTDKNKDGIYTVVLDPGHGGCYSGASHYGTNEKTINMKVAKYCKAYLESTYANVKVYLTHVDENTVFTTRDANDDLEYRVQYAVDRNADLLVSLHFDASSGSASGGEVLIPKKSNVYAKAYTFANYVLDEFKKIGRPVRGIYKRASVRSRYTDGTFMDTYLINRLAAERGMVGVIIEHCYIDCSADRGYWDSDSDLEAYGEADARAIARFLGLYKIGEVTPTPTVTNTPKPTSTPKVTVTKKVTAAPKATNTPKPTVTPKSTATPKITVTPQLTASPTATPVPTVTEVTETPEIPSEATVTPGITTAPETEE